MLRVRGAGQVRAPVQQRAAVERREQPLVGVDDEAVGALDPWNLCPHGGRCQRGAAVGAVDVHPEVAAVAHLGHTGEVVDDAEVGGA